jgi:predicted TIM-barrel enzyme
VAEAVRGQVPVMANTGVTLATVGDILSVADGCIVGTHLKRDGVTWNPVDAERVKRFMDAVERLR